ncbi:transcription termination/antitermination factor NusG [Candidatus Microgenomates bacterium]|nr:transcription termination/antitermination factor NusG [Candidatus Microgenomates bacterium]
MAKRNIKKTILTPEETKQEEIAKENALEAAVAQKAQNHVIIAQTDDPRAKWFVVHTYSGHEARVAASLRQRAETMNQTDKIFEVLIPTQEVVQIRAGKKQNVTEKIFPGYLLVKMILDDASWLTVRTTQGITGFVGVGNKPTPISVSEVEAIQKFMAFGAPKFKVKFSVGEAVKIVDGPFAEFLGSIESIDDEKGKVRVLVSIFGRETPVELDFLQISKI